MIVGAFDFLLGKKAERKKIAQQQELLQSVSVSVVEEEQICGKFLTECSEVTNEERASGYSEETKSILDAIGMDRQEDQAREYDEYIGLCCTTTGGFVHSFRNENGEVFSVSCIAAPMADITLNGFGKKLWCSGKDLQITLWPGVRRNIIDEHDNCYGSYVFRDLRTMYVKIGDEKIRAAVNDTGWIFSSGAEEVARIIRLPEACRTKGCENGFDTERMYFVRISKNLETKWYPLIMGTPMLGF